MPRRSKSAPPKRPGRTISGRGDYATVAAVSGLAKKLDSVLKKVPKGTFKTKGSNVGAAIGRALGSGLSAITGYGDYTVRGNSLGTVSTSTDMVPEFVARREGDHSTRIRHREFLFDLKVPDNPLEFSNGFVQNINPGNPTLFPWLSKMSKLYTQYKIHGMVLVYKTMSSNYSASGGPLGTVIMATNYNVNDTAFDSKIQMENTEFAVSTDPSRNIVHAIECDPKSSGLQTLYIRDPSVNDATQVSDSRFFDYGKFQLATTGLPGAVGSVMGEVWCSYDIELIKPVIGKEQTPTPPTPVPTLTPTNVVVSQSSGVALANTLAAFQLASVQDTTYRGTGPSAIGIPLTPNDGVLTYSGSPLFASAPGNISPVLTLVNAGLNAGAELRIYRNGVYTIQAFCKFLVTTNTNSLINGLNYDATEIYTPTLNPTGTGVTITSFGSSPQSYVPHAIWAGGPADGALPSGGGTLYNAGTFQTSFFVRVSGLPGYDPTRYASVILPYQNNFDNSNAIRGFTRTLNVGWLSTEVYDSDLT